jgi:signal transduction histidine kinase
MEIVGNIAGGIAHEFNNLLTVIQAEAEWGLQRGTDPALRESLDSIRAASGQASQLVFRLLAYSQRQFVEAEAFDLRELVEHAFPADLGLFDGVRSLSIHQCSESLPVFADRTQIKQALQNVGDNALAAIASEGQVWIRTRRAVLSNDFVTTHPGAREGTFAVVEIADDGHGIPKNVMGRVFEPFFTTKRRTGAKGLGLSEAWGSVKRAGGYLDVQSTEAVGTTVALYLPIAQP